MNQTILKLHVDVLDGLLKEVPGLSIMSEVKPETTTATQSEPSIGTGESPDISEDGLEIKTDEGFHFGQGYSIGQWFLVVGVVVFLGLGAIVIWRKM